MRLLVLDLATQLGFAVGTEAGVIEHGWHKLPSTGDDIGAFLQAYRTWLVERIDDHQPEEIMFEMPILPGLGNLATLRKLYSLCGATELIARDNYRRVSEANLLQIRKHFIGSAHAPREIKGKEERRRWLKETTMAECRRRGFRPANSDDADALALFAYGMHCRVPGFVLAGTELQVAAE